MRNKIKRKVFLVLFCVLIFALNEVFLAYADIKRSRGEKYYYDDGIMQTNYFLQGAMFHYFDNEGKMVKNQYIYIDKNVKSNYSIRVEGYCYFDDKGDLIKKDGQRLIDISYFYGDDDYSIVEGEFLINNQEKFLYSKEEIDILNAKKNNENSSHIIYSPAL